MPISLNRMPPTPHDGTPASGHLVHARIRTVMSPTQEFVQPGRQDRGAPYFRHGRHQPAQRRRLGQNAMMASYSINERAVARARRLIDARQYVLDSVWADAQPSAEDENAFLESHAWDDFAEWHLGLTDEATDHTKARYAFVYGDFRRVHRKGLIACQFRAAEWRHKDIELAAHELLQHLDRTSP